MKTKNKIIVGGALIGFSLFAQVNAFAQGSESHGGEAVVCFGDFDPATHLRKVLSSRFMDFNEISKLKIDLGDGDVDAQINHFLARMDRIDFGRAQKVRAKLKEVKSPDFTRWVNREKDLQTIKKIEDGIHYFEPSEPGCVTVQAAFNLTAPGPYEYKYYFMQDYVEKMSTRDQAGLLLHEALYNYEADAKATNSNGVREQIRLFGSRAVDLLSPIEYFSFISRYSQVPSVTALNGSFEKEVEFDPTDASFVREGNVSVPTQYKRITFYDKNANPYTFEVGGLVPAGGSVEFIGSRNDYSVRRGTSYDFGAFVYSLNFERGYRPESDEVFTSELWFKTLNTYVNGSFKVSTLQLGENNWFQQNLYRERDVEIPNGAGKALHLKKSESKYPPIWSSAGLISVYSSKGILNRMRVQAKEKGDFQIVDASGKVFAQKLNFSEAFFSGKRTCGEWQLDVDSAGNVVNTEVHTIQNCTPNW